MYCEVFFYQQNKVVMMLNKLFFTAIVSVFLLGSTQISFSMEDLQQPEYLPRPNKRAMEEQAVVQAGDVQPSAPKKIRIVHNPINSVAKKKLF